MWRLKQDDPERGVVAPLTALLMVVLLGMAAFAVDVGSMYSEHAQLQNGADAAALGIAQACAKDSTSSDCAGPVAAATTLADNNALDGATNVPTATVDLGARTVNVTTQSQDTSGNNHFSLTFARALGIQTADIQASAQATWSPPNNGGGFPLAFSDNCWDLSGSTPTGGLQKISWKPGITCTDASGHTIPGGWGWLTQSSPCYATTQSGSSSIGSDPGNNFPSGCQSVLQGWVDTLNGGGTVKVLFPVFDTATGSGNTGTFHIIGYATFNIVGWKFGNNGSPYAYHNTTSDLGNSNLSCGGGNDRCIIGQFIKYQTIGTAGGGGGSGQDLGTLDIHLSK